MKKYKIPFISLSIFLVIYLLLGYLVSTNMFYTPISSIIDLDPILKKQMLSQEDYDIIFEQTGLARPMIEILQQEPDFKETILRFQSTYFSNPSIKRTSMNALTRMDKSFDATGNWIPSFELAPYENGYIFLSKSTYTFNWRHGHAGIVVDAVRGKVLESLEPGTTSTLQNASKWQYYPTFKMMKLKNTSQETLDEIATSALDMLMDIPYNILAPKKSSDIKSTQCSLLVWQAFNKFGFDLDSNGGLFVSPQDLARSPLLETLQIFGFNPNFAW